MSLFNKLILKIIKNLPKWIVFKFAGKYVAGENINSAIITTKKLNSQGYSVTLDILGEHTKTKKKAKKITEQYSILYDEINKNNLDCNISLKPSHIGLDISYSTCLKNMSHIINNAKKYHNFLRIDMESSFETDKTIKLLVDACKKYSNIGTVFQSYLHRTKSDLMKLKNKNIRLCKGIYREPKEIAFQTKVEINNNYLKLLKFAFKNHFYVAIATHDIYLLQKIYIMIKKMNVSNDQFEFQVLYGVPMFGWMKNHIKNGYKVRVYVPFGSDWYDYSIRRLNENPNIIWYVIKNILSLN